MKYQMPEPALTHYDHGSFYNPTVTKVESYTAAQVQAAFDAGRAAGIEAAAKLIETTEISGGDHTIRLYAATLLAEYCKAIRNLAKETP